MSLHSVVVFSLVLAMAASTEPLAAASMSWVKVNADTYPLKFAYAVPSPNALPSEIKNGTFDVYLVLVDAAIPDKSLASPFWYAHLMDDPNIHGVVFVVDADKKLIGGGLLFLHLKSPNGIWTPTDFKITAGDKEHFEGAGRIAERRLPDGTTIAFDVSVNVPLWKPTPVKPPTAEDAKRAAALPQTKVYLAFLAALKAGNNAAFQDALSADAKKEMGGTAEILAAQMQFFREVAPKSPRVLRVTADGNTAELDVADGAASAGTVQMVLEGGQWKIRSIDSN